MNQIEVEPNDAVQIHSDRFSDITPITPVLEKSHQSELNYTPNTSNKLNVEPTHDIQSRQIRSTRKQIRQALSSLNTSSTSVIDENEHNIMIPAQQTFEVDLEQSEVKILELGDEKETGKSQNSIKDDSNLEDSQLFSQDLFKTPQRKTRNNQRNIATSTVKSSSNNKIEASPFSCTSFIKPETINFEKSEMKSVGLNLDETETSPLSESELNLLGASQTNDKTRISITNNSWRMNMNEILATTIENTHILDDDDNITKSFAQDNNTSLESKQNHEVSLALY